MDKLIIVEGLPGSGKTTFAKMIHQRVSGLSNDVRIFVEGDLHPADMAWCACLTADQYIKLCYKYPHYVKAFEDNKANWNEYVILAYNKIKNLSQELLSYFESQEVYDGRVGKELFCELHKSLWTKFGQEASGINIFECTLLQNHINELLLFHCEEEEKILKFIKALLGSVAKLKPVIAYLDIDSDVSIKRAANERIDANGNRIWEKRVSEYVVNSPYGIKHGLTGSSGMYSYFAKRKNLELKIIEQLSVETYVIPINIDNQAAIEEKFLEKIVSKLLTEESIL